MSPIVDGSDGVLALVVFAMSALFLAVERVAYAWIWNRPESFRAIATRARIGDPVVALEWLFYGFKSVQVGVFTAWCVYFGLTDGWAPISLQPSSLVALMLIDAGQVLNAAVFIRLGRVGVFYGNRFGHRQPWVDGFPFSLLNHPQYVGAVLTIWGVFLLLRYPYPDWIVLPLLETVYYFCGAQAERQPAVATPIVDSAAPAREPELR